MTILMPERDVPCPACAGGSPAPEGWTHCCLPDADKVGPEAVRTGPRPDCGLCYGFGEVVEWLTPKSVEGRAFIAEEVERRRAERERRELAELERLEAEGWESQDAEHRRNRERLKEMRRARRLEDFRARDATTCATCGVRAGSAQSRYDRASGSKEWPCVTCGAPARWARLRVHKWLTRLIHDPVQGQFGEVSATEVRRWIRTEAPREAGEAAEHGARMANTALAMDEDRPIGTKTIKGRVAEHDPREARNVAQGKAWAPSHKTVVAALRCDPRFTEDRPASLGRFEPSVFRWAVVPEVAAAMQDQTAMRERRLELRERNRATIDRFAGTVERSNDEEVRTPMSDAELERWVAMAGEEG